MILKSFNSFLANQNQTSTVRSVNEAKEKFKISQAKPSHENSQGAFTVKYVGPSFDMPVMIAYLQSDPISAPAMQKVKANPGEFFFIYKTMKAGDPRFLAPNSKIWVTYLELIDAKDANGNMLYIGFDKPPYNNFVKFSDVERLINKQDPHVIQAGKKVIGAANTVATQEINKGVASVENSIANGPEGQAGQPNSGMSDAEKSVAANAKQFLNGGASDIDKLLATLKGLKVQDSGARVITLTKLIDSLAQAMNNQEVTNLLRNETNKGSFTYVVVDALQKLLRIPNQPYEINDDIIAKLKALIAKYPNAIKGLQSQNTNANVGQDVNKLMDSLRGLSVGARGQKVDLLQNTIQKLADATHNTTASTENKLNIRGNGLFDDIYRDHTEKALQTVLGLDKMPDHGTIDQTIVDKLKAMLAANPSITAADLMTSNNTPAAKKPQPTSTQPVKPAQPVQPTGPAATQPKQPAKTGVETQSVAQTGHVVSAPFGNIRW